MHLIWTSIIQTKLNISKTWFLPFNVNVKVAIKKSIYFSLSSKQNFFNIITILYTRKYFEYLETVLF